MYLYMCVTYITMTCALVPHAAAAANECCGEAGGAGLRDTHTPSTRLQLFMELHCGTKCKACSCISDYHLTGSDFVAGVTKIIIIKCPAVLPSGPRPQVAQLLEQGGVAIKVTRFQPYIVCIEGDSTLSLRASPDAQPAGGCCEITANV